MARAGAGKPSARTVVHRELRQRIVTLSLPPGAPLSENELAAELAVSRTPVREALLLLAEEDLVQIFPQLGSFVSRVDLRRVSDAQFVREAIEVASLAQAVEKLDEAALDGLRKLLADQRAARRDTERFFELDERFHHQLLAAGGHGDAWRVVVSAKAHLDRARRLGLRTVSPVPALIDQHTAIVDALTEGDPDAAVSAMRTHLRLVFSDVERIRDTSPELFATDSTARPVRKSIAVWR
jgi:DNA-binding GntR family transcriptional regulator